jgi:hypothetical protein
MSEPSITVTQAQPGEGPIVGRLVHALICELAPEGRQAPPIEVSEEVATGCCPTAPTTTGHSSRATPGQNPLAC